MVPAVKPVRVGPKGRVVIPANVREHLDIHEGDELCVVVEGDGVVLLSPEALLKRIQDRFADYPGSLADELIAERRAEALRDLEELGDPRGRP